MFDLEMTIILMLLTGPLRMVMSKSIRFKIMIGTFVTRKFMLNPNSCREVAKVFIESSQWKDALDNVTITRSGRETTPFRELIKKMPGN